MEVSSVDFHKRSGGSRGKILGGSFRFTCPTPRTTGVKLGNLSQHEGQPTTFNC